MRSNSHWLHLRRQMPVLKSSLSAILACKPWTEKHSQPQDDVILWLWVKKMPPCLDLQCNMVRMALSVNPFPHYHYSLHTFFSPHSSTSYAPLILSLFPTPSVPSLSSLSQHFCLFVSFQSLDFTRSHTYCLYFWPCLVIALTTENGGQFLWRE